MASALCLLVIVLPFSFCGLSSLRVVLGVSIIELPPRLLCFGERSFCSASVSLFLFSVLFALVSTLTFSGVSALFPAGLSVCVACVANDLAVSWVGICPSPQFTSLAASLASAILTLTLVVLSLISWCTFFLLMTSSCSSLIASSSTLILSLQAPTSVGFGFPPLVGDLRVNVLSWNAFFSSVLLLVSSKLMSISAVLLWMVSSMLLGPPSRPLSPPVMCSRPNDPMVIYASREAMHGLARSFMGYRAQSRIGVSRDYLNRSYTTIPTVTVTEFERTWRPAKVLPGRRQSRH